MLDLIIKNGKVVSINSISEEDIWINSGKIVGRVDRDTSQVGAKKIIDAEGRYVIPGGIDTHSHIGQLPGQGNYRPQTEKENYITESKTALYGGITTALNYIFTQKSFKKIFSKFQNKNKKYSVIDLIYHGSLMNETHLNEIKDYIDMGLKSFKIFLPYKGKEAEKLGGLSSLNDGQIIKAFEILKKYNGLPIVHAENPELIDYYIKKKQDKSRQDIAAWEETRPAITEGEAVSKIIFFADKVQTRVAIAHVSSAMAVEEIEKAKNEVILETCPHYLALTVGKDLESLGKVSPPIRKKKDQDKLWEAIEKKEKVMIGSDHNSWQKRHKQELWEGLAGLPDNCFILPILYTEGVVKRNLSIKDIVRVNSYMPAKIFNLYPKKGVIQVGSIADLVVMDTDISKYVTPAHLPSIIDYHPYENYEFKAWPKLVIKNGELVYKDDQLLVE